MLRQEPILLWGDVDPQQAAEILEDELGLRPGGGEITAACRRRRTRRRARCRPGSRPWRRSALVSGLYFGAGLGASLRPGRRALSFLRPRSGASIRSCLWAWFGRTLTPGRRRPRSWRTSWARARAVREITAAPCRRRTRRRTRCLPGSRPRRRSSLFLGLFLGPV